MEYLMALMAAASLASSMMQKKPQPPDRIIPPGTNENPGYAGKTPSLVVPNAPPDNRLANGLGGAGSIMSLLGGMGGGATGGAMGSAAPMMTPAQANTMGQTSASNIGFGMPQASGNNLLYKNYFPGN